VSRAANPSAATASAGGGDPRVVESRTVDAPDGGPGSADARGGERPMRADAKRNRDQLIAAARAAFTERGADASLEEIARRAGVGVGTLYRHFPHRQALIEAVYVEEVQALCRSAGEHPEAGSWDALARWFDRFVDYVATKKALVEEMMATIGQDAQVFRTCHDAIYAAGQPLLDRAKQDGAVRRDVEFIDVIRMVSGVAMIRNAAPDDVRRVLAMALDGLRYRDPAAG
jgi:AcrR family transcriptional regulator